MDESFCLECSTRIFPGNDGFEEELCPKHFAEQTEQLITYNCRECEVPTARSGLCRVCDSAHLFSDKEIFEHLMNANVPPRTAKQIDFHHDTVDDIFPGDRSLYLHGPSGSGKTFKAAETIYQYLRSYACDPKHFAPRKIVTFITVPELLDKLRQSFHKPIISDQEGNSWTADSEIMECYKNADVLVLDDLGVEKPSDWVFMILYLIINHRYEHEKTTVITSNFSLDELAERLNDSRLTSRISGWCTAVRFEDRDRREGQT